MFIYDSIGFITLNMVLKYSLTDDKVTLCFFFLSVSLKMKQHLMKMVTMNVKILINIIPCLEMVTMVTMNVKILINIIPCLE